SQPGDGGARRSQSGSRLFSGLPDPQQRFAHPCRRSRRGPHPPHHSFSRARSAAPAGAHTPLTSVVGALAIAFLLLAAPNLLQHLPNAALAAVVIAAAIGFFWIPHPKRDSPIH